MPFVSIFIAAKSAIAAICAVLGLAGTGYFITSIWAARRFQSERSPVASRAFIPPVSILKSLKGLDPQMYAAFRSHCVLDYPEYEMLFGVHDPNDPAISLVEKLRDEFPRQQLRVIHCPETLGLNGKVSNLAQMLPHTRYEHVLVNDSDILVPGDYLLRVLAPFTRTGVGMVTTLYRGLAGSTLGSRLEALGLSTDFTGGVLIARAMEGGIRFGLGATIATTKTILREIGGFEALVAYLGDDYELGARAQFVIVAKVSDQRLEAANFAQNSFCGGNGGSQSKANAALHGSRNQHASGEVRTEAERLQPGPEGAACQAAVERSHHSDPSAGKGRQHAQQIVARHQDVAIVHQHMLITRMGEHLGQVADFPIQSQGFRTVNHPQLLAGKFVAQFL